MDELNVPENNLEKHSKNEGWEAEKKEKKREANDEDAPIGR